MSLALIQESAKEVRRLAIAGSSLAVGDFRLKKLAAPLEQAGAKVPVFAQVAKAIGDLVDGDEARSAERLLTLSTLLNAILYTQGQTGIDGAVEELATTPVTGSVTRTPARVLRPLQEALTRTGGGRFEVVKSAVDAGAFHDLRLVDPAIQALGDAYPELADLVAEKVLPGFGPGIASRLKDGVDLKGKKPDARRLEVLHRVDPATALPLCKAAMEDGAPDVKAAAIACLGEHEDCLPLVLEQAKAKNKQVKAAALEALAKHDRTEVTKLFRELIQGKALDLLTQPFRALKNPQVLGALLEEGRRVFDLMLKGESEQIARFLEVLDCLEQRKEAEVETFVFDCFGQGERVGKLKPATNSQIDGNWVLLKLTGLLYQSGTKRALGAILSQWRTLPPTAFSCALRCGIRCWTEERVFEEFSPLLSATKGNFKDLGNDLERFISHTSPDYISRFSPYATLTENDTGDLGTNEKVSWDPRWLDIAIKTDRPTLVCCLARAKHKVALAYLLKLGDAKNAPDFGLLIRALVRCEYSEATEFFIAQVTKKMKGTKYLEYQARALLENALLLPASDLPKLDAFAATMNENAMDLFLDVLAPLRSTAPTV